MSDLRGTKLSAWMSAHPESPLQKSYDPEVEARYDEHAKVLADNVRADGVTMRPEPGNKPLPVGESQWYGVGGAANPRTGVREPERRYPLKGSPSVQFNNAHALEHLLRTEGMNIDRKAGRTTDGKPWPPAFAGGWNAPNEHTGDPEVTLDYTSVYRGRGQAVRDRAVRAAAQRGERAVFDAKAIDDIPVEPETKK